MKFYVDEKNRKVIAVAGNCKGVAICSPNDEFNFEIGKEIAAARCNYVLANKRYKGVRADVNALLEQKEKLEAEIDKYFKYYDKAVRAKIKAVDNLTDVLDKYY